MNTNTNTNTELYYTMMYYTGAGVPKDRRAPAKGETGTQFSGASLLNVLTPLSLLRAFGC